MAGIRGCVVILLVVLGVVGSTTAIAHADPGAALSIDEPKSGIHLEVEGACLARQKDAGAGTVTCPELAVPGESDVVAVVAANRESAGYTVAVLVEELQLGTGEARARRIAKEVGEALAEPPTVVKYGNQKFVRARLHSQQGGGVGFVTADDRREVAAIVFLTDDAESVAQVEQKADLAMETFRRAPAKPIPPSEPPSGSSQAILIIVIVIAVGLFGLFVFAKFFFIARLFGVKLGGGSDRPIDEPRNPRDPRAEGPQLAGEKCAACKRNIVSEREGMHCGDCERPVHKKCHGRHVTESHGPTAGAYR